MASRLSYYEGAASDREYKFIRSVNSFLSNTYENKELIISSDGCDITNRLYNEHYKNNPNIKLVFGDKSDDIFRGVVRQRGINFSDGDIICFLDTDDELLPNHLEIIMSNINDVDWLYMNNIVMRDDNTTYLRECKLEKSFVGTSSIAYNKKLPVSWDGCDGYGHDWVFINQLIHLDSTYKKIDYSGYLIRHLLGNNVNN